MRPNLHALAEKEPRVRKDGRCLVCGRERPPIAVGNQDPFCSAVCSRKYHGVQDPWIKGRAGSGEAWRDDGDGG
jgi:hypothetical protein